jgi:hypothetical protein
MELCHCPVGAMTGPWPIESNCVQAHYIWQERKPNQALCFLFLFQEYITATARRAFIYLWNLKHMALYYPEQFIIFTFTSSATSTA